MDGQASVIFIVAVIAGLIPSAISSNNTHSYETVTVLKLTPLTPTPVQFRYGEVSKLAFNYTFEKRNITKVETIGWAISVSVENDKVAKISGKNEFYVDMSRPTGSLMVEVSGLNAGRSNLQFNARDVILHPEEYNVETKDLLDYKSNTYQDFNFPIYVVMTERPIDKLFNVVVGLLVVTANIGMGTQVDLDIVKQELKLPVSPIIGMMSQFCFMPLIAYFVAVYLNVDPGIGLGLFASGCAPGGLLSNIFTYLLGGNISLSITMTLISTIASLGFIPMWIFTLGRKLSEKANIKIPFLNIVVSLFVIIIPTIMGLCLQTKRPREAAMLVRSVKYIMAVSMAFIFTVGVYANWWVLNLVDTKVMIASAALPYLGFLLGGLAAFIGRQSNVNVITIAIETGIQNTAVPIVLLRMSLSGPEQATGIVVPIISSMLTPIPLIIAVLYKEIADYYKHTKEETVEVLDVTILKPTTTPPEIETPVKIKLSESDSDIV